MDATYVFVQKSLQPQCCTYAVLQGQLILCFATGYCCINRKYTASELSGNDKIKLTVAALNVT